jgi:ferredoxin
MTQYKVNKERCTGCRSCLAVCPQGFKMGEDGKAEVIDSEAVEKCGGEKICPFGAIEKVSSNDSGSQ